MKTFESVLFDMDGTLIDSERHWLAAETELMAEYGHTWLLEDQQFCLGGPLDKVGKYMSKLAGGAESPTWFRDELVARTLGRMKKDVAFMPGAHELLLELKELEIPTALVTASPRAMMEATLSAIPSSFFDIAISGDDVAITKPNPEAYLLAAERLGVNIENSLVLEDSLTGIAAAEASGAYVLAIPHIVSPKPGPKTKILRTLEGLSAKELENFFTTRDEKVFQ